MTALACARWSICLLQ